MTTGMTTRPGSDNGAAALGGSLLASAAHAGGDNDAPLIAIPVTTKVAVIRWSRIVPRFCIVRRPTPR